jgi:hypothetical protein
VPVSRTCGVPTRVVAGRKSSPSGRKGDKEGAKVPFSPLLLFRAVERLWSPTPCWCSGGLVRGSGDALLSSPLAWLVGSGRPTSIRSRPARWEVRIRVEWGAVAMESPIDSPGRVRRRGWCGLRMPVGRSSGRKRLDVMEDGYSTRSRTGSSAGCSRAPSAQSSRSRDRRQGFGVDLQPRHGS